MPYRRNYPATVAEVLDPAAKFKPAALRAVRAFARSKPWRGTLAERQQKFRRVLKELAHAYDVRVPQFVFHELEGACMTFANGSYMMGTHKITLIGKLSVVTLLHEFGHARGFDERQACRWSINLFRRCFPRSFAACRQVGHMLVRS